VGTVTVGVDVGQRVDPTAVAVVEIEERPREDGRGGTEYHHMDYHHMVRHLERLPLGTPYPQVAERVARIVSGIRARAGSYPELYLDATGVGTPVVDALKDAGVDAKVVATYFNHGDRRTPVEGGKEVRLGKAFLVSRMQALLQSELLHLPRTSEAEVLAEELLDYEIRVSEDANDKYGAFRVGTHDDLVTALGLAVQKDPAPSIALASALDTSGDVRDPNATRGTYIHSHGDALSDGSGADLGPYPTVRFGPPSPGYPESGGSRW
jgi:hypothetical protein